MEVSSLVKDTRNPLKYERRSLPSYITLDGVQKRILLHKDEPKRTRLPQTTNFLANPKAKGLGSVCGICTNWGRVCAARIRVTNTMKGDINAPGAVKVVGVSVTYVR